MYKHLLESAVTLFVVINPIGLVPLYLTAAKDRTPQERRKIAWRAAVIAGAILTFTIALGQILLDALGIGLNAFKIAGGMVLLLISLHMILSDEPEEDDAPRSNNRRDIAVFPLAMPFIAGPGAILACVLLTENDLYSLLEQTAVAGVLVGVLFIVWMVMRFSPYIEKLLGETGVNVVTRLMGLILAALAVQSILTGIKGFFKLS